MAIVRMLAALACLVLVLAGCVTSTSDGSDPLAGGSEGDRSDGGGDDGPSAAGPGASPDGTHDEAAPTDPETPAGSQNGTADGGDGSVGGDPSEDPGPNGSSQPSMQDNSTDGTNETGGSGGDGPGGSNSTTSGNSTQDGGSSGDGGNSTPDDSGGPDDAGGQEAEPETRWLEISVWDLTSDPLAAPGPIVVEVIDNGTWRPDVPPGGNDGPQKMGRHEVDRLHTGGLIIWPEGEGGTSCEVDFQVTADMEDESFDAITQVEIYNTEVWVYGQAIPDAPDWRSPHVCGR